VIPFPGVKRIQTPEATTTPPATTASARSPSPGHPSPGPAEPELAISAAMRVIRAEGVEGPRVMQALSIGFYERERGRRRSRRGAGWSSVDRAAIRVWSEQLLTMLACMSIDLAEEDPRGSANAIWFLAQVGLTPADLGIPRDPGSEPMGPTEERKEQLVAAVWATEPAMLAR
jgi:hypothetical protein